MGDLFKNIGLLLFMEMIGITVSLSMEGENTDFREATGSVVFYNFQYLEEKDLNELQLKVMNGDPGDQYRLALAYIKRDGLDVKSDRVVELLQKSSDQNCKSALMLLCIYKMQCDKENAKAPLLKAADADLNWPLYTLGCLYEKGSQELDIQKDMLKASNFFHRGALAGDIWCQEWIIKKYHKLSSLNVLPEDAAKSAQFLKMIINHEKATFDTYHSSANQEARQQEVAPDFELDSVVNIVDEEDLEEAKGVANWARNRLVKLYSSP